LHAQGKLGRNVHAIPVLIEKDSGSRTRAASYEPGDKIHFRTGKPGV
jgi:hypothetical protein